MSPVCPFAKEKGSDNPANTPTQPKAGRPKTKLSRRCPSLTTLHRVESVCLPRAGNTSALLIYPSPSSRGRKLHLLEPKPHIHPRIRLRERLALGARLVWAGGHSLVLAGLANGLSLSSLLLALTLSLGSCGSWGPE